MAGGSWRRSHTVGGTCGRRAQYGRTALIYAAERGHADCARLLLDAGAHTKAKNKVRASAGGGVRGIEELDGCVSRRAI